MWQQMGRVKWSSCSAAEGDLLWASPCLNQQLTINDSLTARGLDFGGGTKQSCIC